MKGRFQYPKEYFLHFKVLTADVKNEKRALKMELPCDALLEGLDPHRKSAHGALDDLAVMTMVFYGLVKSITWKPLEEFVDLLSSAVDRGMWCIEQEEFSRRQMTIDDEGLEELANAAEYSDFLLEQYEMEFDDNPLALAWLPMLSFWVKALSGQCSIAFEQIIGAGDGGSRMVAREEIRRQMPSLF